MAVPLKEYKLDQIVTFEKSYSFSRACEGVGIFKHIHYGDIHTKLPYIVSDAEKLPNITETGNFVTLNYGDILVADASEDTKDLGKAVCYLDSKNTNVIAGLHTIPVRVNKEIAVPEYLINLFQTKRYRKFVWKMGTGVSVLGLSKTNLATYPIFLPSIDEQRAVANNFIKLNKKIQLQQEKIDLLKEQKKGFMQKVFSQELRFKDEDGNEFPKWTTNILTHFALVNPKSEELNPEFRYIDLEAVVDGELLSTQIISKQSAPSRAQRVVRKEDILYQTVRPYQKNNLLYNHDFSEQVVASTGYAQIKAKGNTDSAFLYQLMNTEKFTYAVLQRCTGTSYPAINSSDLGEIEIQMPVLKEQQKIAIFLSKVDKKIALERNKLKTLQHQKQAFMQQMFI